MDTENRGTPNGYMEQVGEALTSIPPELEIADPDSPPGRILHEARALFAGEGLEGLTMRKVAGRAGVNLALINYYFGSKEKLVHVMIRSEILAMLRDVFSLVDPGLEVPARFIQIPLSLVEVLRRDPVRMGLIRRVLADSPQRLYKAVEELGSHGMLGTSRYVLMMIREAQEAGQLPLVDAGSILLHLMASAYGLILIENIARGLVGFHLDDDEEWKAHRENLERLLSEGLDHSGRKET